MISVWSFVLGLPLLIFGVGAVVAYSRAKAFVGWFEKSSVVAAVLTAVGWFWTAYECDTIGIDVFDMILKRFPGELWILAAVLTVLTFLWMRPNLSVRALTGILMLIPAELFKVTRLMLPESGVGAVHLFVVTGYVGAIVGMYGMFYPWRLEKAMNWIFAAKGRAAVLGVVSAVWGAALILVGISL